MALLWIRARHSCDRCGKWFEVDMDPARTGPADWSLFDQALDAVRGGQVEELQDYKPSRVERALGVYALACSVDDDATLCGPCTKKADEAYFAAHPEEDPQLAATLAKPRSEII